jgi:hypothetical protein
MRQRCLRVRLGTYPDRDAVTDALCDAVADPYGISDPNSSR